VALYQHIHKTIVYKAGSSAASLDVQATHRKPKRDRTVVIQDAPANLVRLSDCGLSVGDVVRSQTHHWMRTGQAVTGAIVRFERVPDDQIDVVGSDYWAYLNSGEGPLSLAVVEKVIMSPDNV